MSFRLITWNCQGAFRRKHGDIAVLAPDILVVPEAEDITGVSWALDSVAVNSVEWIGDNPSKKGLGVVSYGEYSLSVHESYDRSLKYILPLKVTGPSSFTLLAVWTVKHPAVKYYVSCLFEACETYCSLLGEERVVIAGDFNQNVLFDRPRSQAVNYARLIENFASFGLTSLYHLSRGCEQGCELEPTFFLQRKIEKPHHLDYIFATPDMCREGVSISVGRHSEWGALSDHMPLICNFGNL